MIEQFQQGRCGVRQQSDRESVLLLANLSESRARSETLSRQFLSETSGVTGKRQAGFQIDNVVLDQLRNLSVEVLHAFSAARPHRVEQSVVFALSFFNACTSAGVRFQHLECRHAPASVCLWHEALADDIPERLGEALADRLLLGG